MARLGSAVHARRRELRRTQEDVTKLGGPSVVVQSRVENGDTRRGKGISERTLAAFDPA